ncbi:MAG: S8 family serine peptidase [Candidatus Hodarchaeota archaeon]
MKKKQLYSVFILLFLIFSFTNSLPKGSKLSKFSNETLGEIQNKSNPIVSSNYNKNIIVFFNRSSYNSTVKNRFEFYGGKINREWNNQFNYISGFAGVMPNETNKILYQQEFPDANIENDEIIQAQMNYASFQSGAFNSTWYLNGLKGNTNSSVAVLDTGINPNHNFFPNGYNPLDLSGNIVGWQNFVDVQSISDDNGHGTLISSIISGTGKDPFDSNIPSTIKIDGTYSHTELFDEFSDSKNYTLKIFSFNASKTGSNILVNSSWDWEIGGIDSLWFELYRNNELVEYSFHELTNYYYAINHTLTQTNLGIYDLYIKYHKQLQSKPVFSFNTTVSYLPEVYCENINHFTGIANATKIVAYKILNQSGIGYSSDLISALASVIQNRSKYHIVSVCLSVATLGEDVLAVNSVIDEVIENGIMVVIAAGNRGVDISDSLNKLALNKNAIVVGAINDKDQVTSYSSMGKEFENIIKPDIVAPGGSKLPSHRSIIGAGREFDKPTTAYGTSIATAIVSAAINILVEAGWNNWNEWNNLNFTEWIKHIKAYLLMTASETNLEREDDPSTTGDDESEHSPSLSLAPLTNGLKDIHEGYGRINIQAAIDALTKSMEVNSSINGNLVSSRRNPLGTHVFARQIKLTKDTQYSFNLDVPNFFANFDMFLFSNESNQYGEPILLESSRKVYGNFSYFYFTPKEEQTNCVIVIKAVRGRSDFTLNISTVNNIYNPELRVPEIDYIGGSKNTTVLSLQEFMGYEPNSNYSIDSYRFYIEYYDNDTSNVPPQEVYVSIIETSENYTLTQDDPSDTIYTDGTLFISDYIQFAEPNTYQYYFIATDGKFKTRYPELGHLNITIEFPTDSIQVPNHHSFNEGIGNWTYTGTGWELLEQNNINDNRSRFYNNSWNSLYFGTYHDNPLNYTYQPIKPSEDPFPSGSLISPLFNLTNLNENTTHPYAKFGFRVSINAGDFVYFQINPNWTGWTTLRTFTNIEEEWFLENINLTQYIGYFVQFRFETFLNNNSDPINYKGFMLDYFAIENYTNENSPLIEFNLNSGISSTQGSKYQKYTFSCEYYDSDNNYPEFVYLELDDFNYTMYNIFGDWNASSNTIGDKGIYYIKSLILEEISNQSFRFHVSDGKNINTTQWFNRNNSLFRFINPNPLEFNVYQDNKFIGYEFSNTNLSDYYVSGTPMPKESTAWFKGDNSWHPIIRLGKHLIYGGMGQSFGGNDQGYGQNWEIKLITRPLHLRSEYKIYLEFDYQISLQNEFYVPEDQLDRCIVSISEDFGQTWVVLREFTYESEDLVGNKRYDISQYSNEDIIIMFTLHSNNYVPPRPNVGYGWLLSNIYIGYDKLTDFIAPEIDIINPKPDIMIKSIINIEANISDNIDLDESRIYILLNNNSVDRNRLIFNSNTSILEFNWDTTLYNDGIYEIRVVAYDEQGNKAESFIFVSVYNMIWWQTWGPYVILIIAVVIAGIILYIFSEKRGRIWIEKIRTSRIEKMRLQNIDKDQVIKRIELLKDEEELKRPLTLYCKSCRSWFTSKNFDIMCPLCEHDQIYTVYICENCGKIHLKDEPGENYYCKNKNCEGVRLIRREKEEIKKLLAEEGKILREFKSKKKKFSILDV